MSCLFIFLPLSFLSHQSQQIVDSFIASCAMTNWAMAIVEKALFLSVDD
jgi:hypothetical protein